MQFTHLKLLNWRNFASVDVSLATRMFLVGPNASGKSNLLDVLRFLRDTAKPGGGFQKAVTDRGGVSSLRCLAARRYSDITVEVTVGTPSDIKQSPLWKYRIEFSQDNQRKPVLKREQVWKAGEEILNRPNKEDRGDPARLTQTHLEQVNMNQEFRDLARFFQSIRYLHLVPHIIRDPERYLMRSDDPFGGDFLEQLAITPEKTREARLRKIQAALRIVVPQLKKLQLERDSRGAPHLKALYEHWRPKAGWQDEKVFSDGTLRFLGFLWSLLDGQGPLLLEEPELSLHAGIVHHLGGVIYRLQKAKKKAKRRQVLVSTHSAELISDEGIGADEVLVLQPANEGTNVFVGKDNRQIRALMEAGLSVAEAVLPMTEPKDALQLELFKP
jgi:predicted ATPase